MIKVAFEPGSQNIRITTREFGMSSVDFVDTENNTLKRHT